MNTYAWCVAYGAVVGGITGVFATVSVITFLDWYRGWAYDRKLEAERQDREGAIEWERQRRLRPHSTPTSGRRWPGQ